MARASSALDIIIGIVDKASGKLKEVNKGVSDLSGSTEKLNKDFAASDGQLNSWGNTLSDLTGILAKVTGVAAIIGITLKKAFDLGEQGAAIQQTTESFGLLLEKVDAAPDLLNQLRAASKNTISDLDLMRSTATLLAGASGDLATSLANATPELLEIAKAANKLNPSLGDTASQYQSIATGIKRASPLILDNLGLTIKIEEANTRYAESIGKTVEQLTAEEMKMALLEETLRAGRVLIEQVGGTTDSATDSFSRLEAATKNIADELKANLAPSLATAADALFLIMTWQEKVNEALEEGATGLIVVAKSYTEYELGLRRLAETAGKVVMTQKQFDDAVEAGGHAADYARRSVILLTEEQWEAKRVEELLGDSRREAIETMRAYTTAAREGASASEKQSEAIRGITLALSEVTSMTIAQETLNELNEEWEAGNIDMPTYKRLFADIAANIGGLPADTINAQLALLELRASFEETGTSIFEDIEHAKNFKAALDNLPSTKYIDIFVNYHERTWGTRPPAAPGNYSPIAPGDNTGGGPIREFGGDIEIMNNTKPNAPNIIIQNLNVNPAPGMDEIDIASEVVRVIMDLAEANRGGDFAGLSYAG